MQVLLQLEWFPNWVLEYRLCCALQVAERQSLRAQLAVVLSLVVHMLCPHRTAN
jgi:Trm5-related predicted tRNA methylase